MSGPTSTLAHCVKRARADFRKFNALYKEYHSENKAVNSQPPTSSRYLLRLYPSTIERDALLEAAEVEYQYKLVCTGLKNEAQLIVRAAQAKKMYESERESIEGQYWDARDQVRQRLLSAIEERRRKLREEKEGGDMITGKCASHAVIAISGPNSVSQRSD